MSCNGASARTSFATEHILLGIIREGDGVADYRILQQLTSTATLDLVRWRILEAAGAADAPNAEQSEQEWCPFATRTRRRGSKGSSEESNVLERRPLE